MERGGICDYNNYLKQIKSSKFSSHIGKEAKYSCCMESVFIVRCIYYPALSKLNKQTEDNASYLFLLSLKGGSSSSSEQEHCLNHKKHICKQWNEQINNGIKTCHSWKTVDHYYHYIAKCYYHHLRKCLQRDSAMGIINLRA
ncbi:hypothetical protein BLOT_003001 [Blomia tropicalis]|nr:hypothetical protein BLOT_003001 [Blomia tropicalis]